MTSTPTGSPAGAFPSAAPTTPADAERRRVLTYVAGAVGGAGLIATAYPFVDSFEPSAQALAAGGPVEAAWGDLRPGQLRTVAWRGKPVWVMRRTPAMVAELDRGIPQLADPDSKHSEQPAACRNATRSLLPDLFVAVGICTHLGCSPVLKVGDPAFEAQMNGEDGFFCPCHGSRYDLAGRVVKNVPAPLNLEIPPYALQPGQRVRIG
jgi:ubiquinol-cytochrome c reductase iron-sulfur subunit